MDPDPQHPPPAPARAWRLADLAVVAAALLLALAGSLVLQLAGRTWRPRVAVFTALFLPLLALRLWIRGPAA